MTYEQFLKSIHFDSNYPGTVTGKLTALRFVKHIFTGGQKKQVWLYRCSCGREKELLKARVQFGITKSCGCLRGRNKVKTLLKKPDTFKPTFDKQFSGIY